MTFNRKVLEVTDEAIYTYGRRRRLHGQTVRDLRLLLYDLVRWADYATTPDGRFQMGRLNVSVDGLARLWGITRREMQRRVDHLKAIVIEEKLSQDGQVTIPLITASAKGFRKGEVSRRSSCAANGQVTSTTAVKYGTQLHLPIYAALTGKDMDPRSSYTVQDGTFLKEHTSKELHRPKRSSTTDVRTGNEPEDLPTTKASSESDDHNQDGVRKSTLLSVNKPMTSGSPHNPIDPASKTSLRKGGDEASEKTPSIVIPPPESQGPDQVQQGSVYKPYKELPTDPTPPTMSLGVLQGKIDGIIGRRVHWRREDKPAGNQLQNFLDDIGSETILDLVGANKANIRDAANPAGYILVILRDADLADLARIEDRTGGTTRAKPREALLIRAPRQGRPIRQVMNEVRKKAWGKDALPYYNQLFKGGVSHIHQKTWCLIQRLSKSRDRDELGRTPELLALTKLVREGYKFETGIEAFEAAEDRQRRSHVNELELASVVRATA